MSCFESVSLIRDYISPELFLPQTTRIPHRAGSLKSVVLSTLRMQHNDKYLGCLKLVFQSRQGFEMGSNRIRGNTKIRFNNGLNNYICAKLIKAFQS